MTANFGKITISTDVGLYDSFDNMSYGNHNIVFGRANAEAHQIPDLIMKSTEFLWKSVVFSL